VHPQLLHLLHIEPKIQTKHGTYSQAPPANTFKCFRVCHLTAAYLEIGQGGGHIKEVWGMEVTQRGTEAEPLLGVWAEAPEAEQFFKCKLNRVYE